MIQWPYKLIEGMGDDPLRGSCAMAAISWLVEGVYSDTPACASPIITAFVIAGNDAMDEITRQRLLGYLHRIAGSRDQSAETARERFLLTDALMRERKRWPNRLPLEDDLNMTIVAGLAPEVFMNVMIEFRADWEVYFDMLDQVLKLGAEGEPWSADVVAVGVARYQQAIGLVHDFG